VTPTSAIGRVLLVLQNGSQAFVTNGEKTEEKMLQLKTYVNKLQIKYESERKLGVLFNHRQKRNEKLENPYTCKTRGF
jgi:hypothetical protein